MWGPHGTRVARRVKLTGLKLATDGNLRMVELFGPDSVSAWESCHEVWATACLKLDLVGRTLLSKYLRLIRGYEARYTSKVWHIIYQADVRFRSEQLDKTHAKLVLAHSELTTSGGFSTYNPDRPWHEAMKAGLEKEK